MDNKTVRFLGLDCIVEMHRYANERPALVLTHGGEQVAVATINMPGIPLGPNDVVIKNYSENEGMMKALIEGGIITDTNVKTSGGFPIAVLHPSFQTSLTSGVQAKAVETPQRWPSEIAQANREKQPEHGQSRSNSHNHGHEM